MARIDVQDSLLRVSTDGVTFTTIVDMEEWTGTHGEESEDRRRVFGNPDPIIRAGDDTDEYSLSGLLDLADTNGQNILRTAKDNRTNIYLRVLPEGATSGDKGYTQQCRVSQFEDRGSAGGTWVECAFTLRGVGTRTAYVVPT
jgi:hypothetical protein